MKLRQNDFGSAVFGCELWYELKKVTNLKKKRRRKKIILILNAKNDGQDTQRDKKLLIFGVVKCSCDKMILGVPFLVVTID